MCQMRIVLKQGGSEKVVLENAALLEVTAEGIRVSALFEEPVLIPGAEVCDIDFLKSKLTLTTSSRKAAHGLEDNG